MELDPKDLQIKNRKMENKFNKGDLVVVELQSKTFYQARVIGMEGDDVRVFLIKDMRYLNGLFRGNEIVITSNKIEKYGKK
jgi:hypothetical protein